jgi:hypothetical protein
MHGIADASLAPRYRRWRIQIFVITWLAYAGFYLTRKSFSVAKVGIQDDPSLRMTDAQMAWIDGAYLTAYAVGQFLFGLGATEPSQRLVHCDLCQPGRELRFTSKLVEPREGPQICLLHGIFGGIVVAKNRSCRPKETLIVSTNDQFEQSSLAIEDAPDNLFIGQSGDCFCQRWVELASHDPTECLTPKRLQRIFIVTSEPNSILFERRFR